MYFMMRSVVTLVLLSVFGSQMVCGIGRDGLGGHSFSSNKEENQAVARQSVTDIILPDGRVLLGGRLSSSTTTSSPTTTTSPTTTSTQPTGQTGQAGIPGGIGEEDQQSTTAEPSQPVPEVTTAEPSQPMPEVTTAGNIDQNKSQIKCYHCYY